MLTAALLLALSPAASAAAPLDSGQPRAAAATCPKGKIKRGNGCVSAKVAARRVVEIARQIAAQNGLRAVLMRVDVGDRKLVSASLGQSQAGVKANNRMHFRIGSIAVSYLTTLLLQLRDEGRLEIDDPLAKWFPGYPNADRVTLRMLTNGTSGYPDYIQLNDAFSELLYQNPFRQFTPEELTQTAFELPLACDPGACFRYSHTNYLILSEVLRKETGKPVGRLMRRRILNPLGLDDTEISALPAIPGPVLHSYVTDRGVYEDASFWTPSWTLGRGTIMTSTIGDVARSAAAIGTGSLLSRKSHRLQVSPPQLAGSDPNLYFGLGVVLAGGWRIQNPSANGYIGLMANLPGRRISIAIESTRGPSSADRHHSGVIFNAVAEYLAPDRPPGLPG